MSVLGFLLDVVSWVLVSEVQMEVVLEYHYDYSSEEEMERDRVSVSS